ncbi:hypothetical protein J0B03_05490 [Alkalibacter rhizosphaerae]|uniref:HTH luxR-type domain-containing protein n=1 Tax=Alkalibacter rhizosphaerae TaxID=2815577 RepID=A0A975AII7_9FIRM|nr:helix-turn-helix transcriptional regulator [Alkalibacter rhizosphaerae]QSX09517.1 hypothetical protein J0B03_05490 [Alkalibacter rhizosphaerae]
MAPSANIPWQEIYDVTLACGNVHERKAFSVEVLSQLKKLCDFDESLVYFLDGNGKICNQYLMNIDKHWSTMYLEYFSKVEGSFKIKNVRENSTKPMMNIRAWNEESSSDFISNYIRPRNLQYSLGFVLFDINGRPRTIFALDRKKDENFSEKEVEILNLIIPLLNNLHKNFFSQKTVSPGAEHISWETANLTPREIEVVNLLCKGVSPASISETLHISQSTTNKHIAHIYEKMHVSTRQELIVRLLG